VDLLKGLGVKVIESYGMAETCGGCVYDGEPLDGVKVEIIDGLVAISGTTLAKGVGEQYLSSDLGEISGGRLGSWKGRQGDHLRRQESLPG